MGSTTSSYPLTSEDCDDLSGLSTNWTSEQLKARSDVPDTSFTSADLLGLTDYVPMTTPALSTTSLTVKGATGVNSSYTLWSGTVTCSTPSNGSGTKTFTWEKVSGTTLGLSSGSSASTTFGLTTVGADLSGVYRCKVTDGTGASVYSNNVTIRFVHYLLVSSGFTDCSNFLAFGETAVAGYYVYRDGTAKRRLGATLSDVNSWVTPRTPTVGDDFEIYISNVAYTGDNSDLDIASPSINTWGQINTTRYTYEANATASTTEKAGANFKVRLRSGVGTNLETYPINKSFGLTAQVGASSPPPSIGGAEP